MTELYPKWIVVTVDGNDRLIIGKVKYHKDLCEENKENVKGGGWWKYNPNENSFTLGGSSFEFGRCKEEDIIACIENEEVYPNKMYRTMNNHTFKLDRESEIVTIKTQKKKS
jgi:hypothetical protein